MAWFHRKTAAGLKHHSDRGSQYASHAFQTKLKKYGMASLLEDEKPREGHLSY